MGYNYTTRDGERVEVHVAAAYDQMAAAFRSTFGVSLHVTSGTRTNAEQWQLWRAYQNGTGNLAAYPGTSNHEEGGPRGPRALDLRDSGSDAGVTSLGTTRGNWLANNAHRWGFTQAGRHFSQVEPWHYEYTGSFSGATAGASGYSEKTKHEQSWLNIYRGERLAVDGIQGAATTEAIKRYQNFLGVAADGIWGDGTQAAHAVKYAEWERAQKRPSGTAAPAFPLPAGYYFGPRSGPANSISGFNNNSHHLRTWQERMKARGWIITVDGLYGPNTAEVATAFQRQKGLTADGLIGPSTWAAAWTAPVT